MLVNAGDICCSSWVNSSDQLQEKAKPKISLPSLCIFSESWNKCLNEELFSSFSSLTISNCVLKMHICCALLTLQDAIFYLRNDKCIGQHWILKNQHWPSGRNGKFVMLTQEGEHRVCSVFGKFKVLVWECYSQLLLQALKTSQWLRFLNVKDLIAKFTEKSVLNNRWNL